MNVAIYHEDRIVAIGLLGCDRPHLRGHVSYEWEGNGEDPAPWRRRCIKEAPRMPTSYSSRACSKKGRDVAIMTALGIT